MAKEKKGKNSNEHRVRSSTLNMVSSASSQILIGLFSFVERTIFLRYLTTELSGLNSLFGTILSVLTITELGINAAIAFGLYKPLSENDEATICAYMRVFKRAYYIIGSVIIGMGLLLTPFIDTITHTDGKIDNTQLYFVIYLLAVGLTYFQSYKAVLLEADQKKYIVNIVANVGTALQYLLQILILILTKSYLCYLIVFFIINISKYVYLSHVTSKRYKFLKAKEYKGVKLDKGNYSRLRKNISAIFFIKVGSVLINSTDNLLISSMLSLTALGLYANYKMIIDSLNGAMRVFYTSIAASIGNICAVDSDDEIYSSYKNLNFVNFLLFALSAILIITCLQPLIQIWFGEKYLLDYSTVLILAFCFLLEGLRRISVNYHDAEGLFYVDKYKCLIEALINLVFSYFLARRLGINGIFLGTIIGQLTVGIWYEAYVLFKYGFQRSFGEYLLMLLKFLVSFALVAGATVFISSFIDTSNVLLLVLRALVSLALSIALFSLLFCQSREFKATTSFLKQYFNGLR